MVPTTQRPLWTSPLVECTSGVLLDTSSLKYHSFCQSDDFWALEGDSPIVACPCWRSTSTQLDTRGEDPRTVQHCS